MGLRARIRREVTRKTELYGVEIDKLKIYFAELKDKVAVIGEKVNDIKPK